MIHNISKFIAALALLATAQTAWAEWTGTGTSTDPYIISTQEDLLLLAHRVNGTNGETANDYEGKYFKLGADITFDHAENEGDDYAENYEAIGGYYNGTTRNFRGTFDGANHTVSGIRINKIGTAYADYYQGLFGLISSPAEVKSVILADASITGNNHTGAIVGYNYCGTVTGCHALADVTVHAVQSNVWNHGGIAGYNAGGTFTRCTSAAALTTDGSDSRYFGGIIGYNNGTVTDCIYLGTTLDGAKYVGAIVGQNNSTGTVGTSYFTDTAIQGKDNSGNTLGNAASAVGNNLSGGTVANSGLAHTVTLGKGITLSDIPTGEGSVKAYGNYALSYSDGTTTTLYSTAGSTLALACTPPAGYLFDGYTASAGTISGSSLTMPDQDVTITAFTPDPAHFSQSGDTYTIITATGWNVFCDLLADNTMGYFSGKTVQLVADITVTRMAGGQNHAFTGTFDGGDHTLTLAYGTADAPIDAQFVAPFLETANDGEHQPTFRNLTIAGSIYDGYTGSEAHNIGGLIGHLFGNVTIEHCTSLVEIHAKVGAGGFVGLCEHSVSFNDCHSAAIIRSADGSNSGFVAWSRASAHTIAFTGCLFDGKLLQQNGSGSYNGGFIGWTGSTKTVTITNSLCAPAPLADGETMASTGSATFARGWNATTTATNSYYTAAFEIAQGKATRTVAAAAAVTIGAIALTGTPTQYTVSGITAYSGGGLQRGQTLYYGSDDQLSLTLSAPQGYRYDGFTAYTASAGTLSGTTLTMPDENVTISVNTAAILSTGQPVTVAFIKADGTTQTEQAVALDGHEAVDEDGYVRLDAGTYYVGTDIAYANQIRPDGDITLILANGKTMTLNGNTKGIYGSLNLTIYGQSLDAAIAGTLSYDGTADGITVNNYVQHSGNVSITTTGSWVWSIKANVTLRGGTLTISANGNNARAISGTMHSIFGGLLDATATGTGATGIYAFASSGTAITLGWTRPADRITASSISTRGGTVAVKDGQALTDGSGNIYTGTLTASELSVFAAETTLQPCLALADAADNTAAITDHAGQPLAVALSGRTLYKDGSWNTLCLPFAVSTASGTLSGDNVQAMTLNTTTSNLTGSTLTLNFTAATGQTIPAGTPFIIKWDKPGDYEAYDGQNAATCSDLVSPVFMGVTIDAENRDATVAGVLTFTGTYAPVSITDATGDNTKLYLGAANKLYYPKKAMTIGTHRAYFQLLGDLTAGEPASLVRAFALNFGDDEATGIISVHDSGFTVNGSNAWYTLDGRRLDGQPTAKGLYIHGGKKVVIK